MTRAQKLHAHAVREAKVAAWRNAHGGTIASARVHIQQVRA